MQPRTTEKVFAHCPNCNSEDYLDAARCWGCDEYFAEEYLDGGWCDECKAKIKKQFSLIVQEFYIKLSNELKVSVEKVQELVNDMFDGEDIC